MVDLRIEWRDRGRITSRVAVAAPAQGLAPRAESLAGIHRGHADLRVVLTSLDGTVLMQQRHFLDVDHEPAASLDQLARSTADLLATGDVDRARVLAVGVAVSAPVVDSRMLASPPMLLDWGGVDIAGVLSERTGLPVHIGNDATLGALAEWRLGAGTAVDDLVYVMLGEGVGCGLVLGGRLHTGASGTAGELGHLPVVSDGKICRCGSRGCLETVVSKHALVSALAHTMGLEAKVGTGDFDWQAAERATDAADEQRLADLAELRRVVKDRQYRRFCTRTQVGNHELFIAAPHGQEGDDVALGIARLGRDGVLEAGGAIRWQVPDSAFRRPVESYVPGFGPRGG